MKAEELKLDYFKIYDVADHRVEYRVAMRELIARVRALLRHVPGVFPPKDCLSAHPTLTFRTFGCLYLNRCAGRL